MDTRLKTLRKELESAQHALVQCKEKFSLKDSKFQLAIQNLKNTNETIEDAYLEWEYALDSLKDPLFTHDKEFRILRCNRAYQQYAGLPFEEIIGQPYFEIFPKINAPFHTCIQALKKSTEEVEEVQVGDIIFRSRAYATKDKQGKYLYSIHILEDITEQRLNEEELRAGKEKFRLVADSAKNAILVMDDEGNISYWNKAAVNTFGYLEQEAIGESLHELLSPERFLEAHRIGFSHFIKTGEGPVIGKTLELTALKKDGTEFPIELSLSAINKRGKWNAIGVINDITERIESEKELEKSEEKYRQLVESSSDLIWEVDSYARYVYVSPNIKELLGYEIDEVIGKTPFELMTQEDAQVISKTFSNIVKAQKSFDGLINANRHKDGRIVIMESSGVHILDKHGGLSGYRGVTRNITERIRSEKALSKARERLHLFFQQSPFAIIEWDLDLKVVAWNPAAEEIFGYTKSEALGRNASDLIIPEDLITHVDAIWSALLSQKGGLRNTHENVTKEGNTIVCSWYNTPLIDANGKIIGVSSIAENVTIQEEAKRKIEYMAYYDTLTDLPNRTLFQDRLEQECRKADREKNIVGILFMDMDHFKNINDTLGHLVGDLLIKAVADRLKNTFRKSDTISRFGGDEFAIIIPKLKKVEDIYIVLKSVIDKFKIPFQILEFEFFVTFSTGITFYPLDDTDSDTLLRNADTAMYHAKELGRNQYQRYNSKMTQEMNKNFSLQNDLRQAIDHEELILYYQPQIDSRSGIMTGVEALVRWEHPQKGLIFPADFIPIAEKSVLIVPIGEWILRTACKQVKAWQKQGFTNITMAVNLSSRQFKEEGFAQSVIDIKNEYELDINQLELELTESILMDNDDSVLGALDAFKEAGILLAIDDFGTGYSSLSYLNYFPIDKLKIDQSFTRNVMEDSKIATLVRAIISMGKALGLEIIAEGVETVEQQDFIRMEGCDTIQGYFTGRPMPPKELEAFLNNNLLNFRR